MKIIDYFIHKNFVLQFEMASSSKFKIVVLWVCRSLTCKVKGVEVIGQSQSFNFNVTFKSLVIQGCNEKNSQRSDLRIF